MVTLSAMLLIAAALLICIEIFMPGFGVCGVTGAALFIISSVITVALVPFGVFVVLAEFVFIALVLFTIYQYVKKRQLHGKLILDETLNMEKREIGGLDFFMGKEGLTKSPLKPVGYADFNGNSVEVYSEGAYIPENKHIKVVSVDTQRIIVRPIQ